MHTNKSDPRAFEFINFRLPCSTPTTLRRAGRQQQRYTIATAATLLNDAANNREAHTHRAAQPRVFHHLKLRGFQALYSRSLWAWGRSSLRPRREPRVPKFGDGERAIHLEEASCRKKKPSESYHNAARRRVKVGVCSMLNRLTR